MKRKKIVVHRLLIPVGTPAGIHVSDFSLEKGFPNVVGFYAIRMRGTDPLQVGITQGNNQIVLEKVNVQHLEVSTDVKISDRFFRETPFTGEQIIKIEFRTYGNPAAPGTVSVNAQEFDILFEIESA